MAVRIVLIHVLVFSIMSCVFSDDTDSLGGKGKKGQRQQYNLSLNHTMQFGQGVDSYFRNYHDNKKTKNQRHQQPTSRQDDAAYASLAGDIECKWTAWGPKTRLFGCGEQQRMLTNDSGYLCKAPVIERRQTCHHPRFRDQLLYFKVYFVDHVEQVYSQTGKDKRSVNSQHSLDLLLLVDRSKSMQRYEFSLIREAMADLIKQMNLTVSPRDTQVAMVTFGTSSKVEFKFNEHRTTADVKQAILSVPQYRAGSSQLEQALQYCSRVFDPSEQQFGARTDSGRVLLILTDGESLYDPNQAAEDLKRRLGVEIFVVGFKRISEQQMMAVSSHPKHHHVFYFENAGKVRKMVERLPSVNVKKLKP